jgi:hypothetical protein
LNEIFRAECVQPYSHIHVALCSFQFKHQAMSIQHLSHRNLSPATIVGLTSLAIVAALLLGLYAGGAHAVDPRVTLRPEQGGTGRTPAAVSSSVATTMDGEVARMADRIGEATTLALSAGVYLAGTGVQGRPPRDVQTLVLGLARTGLLPPGFAATGSAGTLVSAWGSLSVRYRPSPLGVEVVSIASKPDYGPALIVRLPDETSENGEARLYVAGRLQGVTVPAPFASSAEVIALGWSPERLRSLK